MNGGGTGANWHFGATAGYLESDVKDTTVGGTFKGNFQVPFAGVYTAFTKGNFALDGQARWDFYQNKLDDVANGLFGQSFNGHGFSLTGNAAYTFQLPNNWFIEPSAGAVWSRVQLDPLNVSGTFVLENSPFFGAPGTVQINDIESLLGRVSLSTGTSFSTGLVTWQPFFTASVFHEFKGDVSTTITTHLERLGFAATDNGTATLSTSRVGTYGQFALGTAAILGNTGWLGYGRVDYRIGENIEGWSVNAGLRYQFSPTPGRGSIKDGPALAAWDTYNWTGAYVGGFAGRTVGEEQWRYINFGTTVQPEFGGHIFGGQAGYNVQFGRIVVGVEGDYGFSNANGGKSCPNGFFFTCEAEADRLASLTGRLGFTWGRALFYAKGGWAAGEITAKGFQNTGGQPIFQGVPNPPNLATGASTSNWVGGWTLGGGMEFALTDRWSAKAEYMHFDLEKDRYLVDNSGGGGGLVDASARGDTVRVGVNYHFNTMREPGPLK